jgi:N-methylhydantoinase A/oxoprolinase/acetone carboxylase beta subunit
MFKFKKKKKEPENLKEVLDSFHELKESFEKIKKEFNELREKNSFNIQKIGMVRFNPFKEVGGNQSFSLALLDGNDNGIVITSLYTREENRVYGKPIKNGQSEYLLSEEEKKAIELAKNSNQK